MSETSFFKIILGLEPIWGSESQCWAPEANFGLGEQILGFGAQFCALDQFWAWANIRLWGQFWALALGHFALWSEFLAVATILGPEAIGAILGFGANFGLWEPIFCSGRQFWA